MAIDLLLVRGAPGVGKHDAVTQLRALLSHGAVVDVGVFRSMFVRPSTADRQQHLIALQLARVAAVHLVDKQVSPVVLIDTFTSGKLASFVAGLSYPYRLASLYCSPEGLRQRLLARGASTREIESAAMINAEIGVRRHPHEKLIDTTGRDAATVAASLRKWLRET